MSENNHPMQAMIQTFEKLSRSVHAHLVNFIGFPQNPLAPKKNESTLFSLSPNIPKKNEQHSAGDHTLLQPEDIINVVSTHYLMFQCWVIIINLLLLFNEEVEFMFGRCSMKVSNGCVSHVACCVPLLWVDLLANILRGYFCSDFPLFSESEVWRLRTAATLCSFRIYLHSCSADVQSL